MCECTGRAGCVHAPPRSVWRLGDRYGAIGAGATLSDFGGGRYGDFKNQPPAIRKDETTLQTQLSNTNPLTRPVRLVQFIELLDRETYGKGFKSEIAAIYPHS